MLHHHSHHHRGAGGGGSSGRDRSLDSPAVSPSSSPMREVGYDSPRNSLSSDIDSLAHPIDAIRSVFQQLLFMRASLTPSSFPHSLRSAAPSRSSSNVSSSQTQEKVGRSASAVLSSPSLSNAVPPSSSRQSFSQSSSSSSHQNQHTQTHGSDTPEVIPMIDSLLSQLEPYVVASLSLSGADSPPLAGGGLGLGSGLPLSLSQTRSTSPSGSSSPQRGPAPMGSGLLPAAAASLSLNRQDSSESSSDNGNGSSSSGPTPMEITVDPPSPSAPHKRPASAAAAAATALASSKPSSTATPHSSRRPSRSSMISSLAKPAAPPDPSTISSALAAVHTVRDLAKSGELDTHHLHSSQQQRRRRNSVHRISGSLSDTEGLLPTNRALLQRRGSIVGRASLLQGRGSGSSTSSSGSSGLGSARGSLSAAAAAGAGGHRGSLTGLGLLPYYFGGYGRLGGGSGVGASGGAIGGGLVPHGDAGRSLLLRPRRRLGPVTRSMTRRMEEEKFREDFMHEMVRSHNPKEREAIDWVEMMFLGSPQLTESASTLQRRLQEQLAAADADAAASEAEAAGAGNNGVASSSSAATAMTDIESADEREQKKQEQQRSLGALVNTRRIAKTWRSKTATNSLLRNLSDPQVKSQLEKLGTWEFDVLSLFERTQKPLSLVMKKLFDDLNFAESLQIDPEKFMSYISVVEDKYEMVPYHNRFHAADVAANMYFWSRSKTFRRFVSSDLDLFTALVAAAVHDVGHPGTSNEFQVNTRSDLAVLYNDQSVLENMHCSTAIRLLSESEHNFISHMTRADQKQVRETIIAMVLSTDMHKHRENVQDLQALIDRFRERRPSSSSGRRGSGGGGARKALHGHDHNRNRSISATAETKERPTSAKRSSSARSKSKRTFEVTRADRFTLLKSGLHAADVAVPTKGGAITSKWTMRLFDEFYAQGDRERQLSLPISPSMDRRNPNVEVAQLKFCEWIIEPLFSRWAQIIPEGSVCIRQLKRNVHKWEADDKRKRTASADSSATTTDTDAAASSTSTSAPPNKKRSRPPLGGGNGSGRTGGGGIGSNHLSSARTPSKKPRSSRSHSTDRRGDGSRTSSDSRNHKRRRKKKHLPAAPAPPPPSHSTATSRAMSDDFDDDDDADDSSPSTASDSSWSPADEPAAAARRNVPVPMTDDVTVDRSSPPSASTLIKRKNSGNSVPYSSSSAISPHAPPSHPSQNNGSVSQTESPSHVPAHSNAQSPTHAQTNTTSSRLSAPHDSISSPSDAPESTTNTPHSHAHSYTHSTRKRRRRSRSSSRVSPPEPLDTSERREATTDLSSRPVTSHADKAKEKEKVGPHATNHDRIVSTADAPKVGARRSAANGHARSPRSRKARRRMSFSSPSSSALPTHSEKPAQDQDIDGSSSVPAAASQSVTTTIRDDNIANNSDASSQNERPKTAKSPRPRSASRTNATAITSRSGTGSPVVV